MVLKGHLEVFVEKKRSKFAIEKYQQIQSNTKLNSNIPEYTIYIGFETLFYKRYKDPKRNNNIKFEIKIKSHIKKKLNI